MRFPRLLWAISVSIWAQPAPPPFDVRANYTKYEFRVPMRDGKRLFLSVYTPKDTSKPYPILLSRTPYSVAPYGVDQYRTSLGPSEKLMKEGYIFAYEDVRGRYMSEGVWEEVRPHKPSKGPKDTDESTDTWDSIDWMVKNLPNNNGKVGMYGISYPGFYVSAGMIDSHPALKAASPQAPVTDYFMGDDSFHNGAFMLAANFGFYTAFKPRAGDPAPPPKFREPFDYGTPDGYDFFLRLGPLANADELYFNHANPYWTINTDHTTYDAFWKARALQNHLKNIKAAVMTVGGWFDAEDLQGPLRVFRSVGANNPGLPNVLVMGPWTHGSWSREEGNRVGHLDFAIKTGAYYRDNIEAPFFEYFLKGKGTGKFPAAYVFQTGVNQWRTHDAWPPAKSHPVTFYLADAGKLTDRAPSGNGFDEYLSDPNKPVPYLWHPAQGMTRDYMTEDQRAAAARPDVLVYQGPVLEEDLTLAGPVRATLQVSTTGTDSDFVVKLIDVFPADYPSPGEAAPGPPRAPVPQGYLLPMGGYQQLVRGEPFRGKFRNSFEKPEPFEPGKMAKIDFEMPDIYHTFRRGHRVMVQIQSSWFPLVDRNPQKFLDIPNAKPADFVKATQRVYRGSAIRALATD